MSMMSFPPSCRILTVSSSINRAKQLAERIITASNTAEGQSSPHETSTERLLWTISNKYYTAPVHFSFAQNASVTAQDAADVPACIFVFSPAENFKDEFSSMIAHLGVSDFEVSMAVSLPPVEAEPLTSDEKDTFEGFFGEHGFEYVEGRFDHDLAQERDVEDSEGIPGISRTIDALSTILWPSMVQKSGSRRTKTRSIVSVPGPPGEEDGLRSLLSADREPTEAPTALQREMTSLEKWLEEGADDEMDPWIGVAQTEVDSEDSTATLDSSRPSDSGFDDNFSDFMSAPAPTKPGLNDDPALPSQTDVELMSQRIFQTGVLEDADEDDPQVPFDLSRVLAALEAMKEEIAGITDEDEKRKAAAKVALGLVYGLDEG